MELGENARRETRDVKRETIEAKRETSKIKSYKIVFKRKTHSTTKTILTVSNRLNSPPRG